jgi:hypothetical protein
VKFFLIITSFILPAILHAALRIGTQSIYNFDNRELISQSSPPQILNLKKSVALIFNSDDLITENNQLLIFANLLLDLPPVGMNICPNERYADHHAYKSACSGFLVGKDLLATAGHCMDNQFSCDNQLIAFDVDADSEISRGFKTQEENIYHCKEIVAHFKQKGSMKDYAVIRLDRETDRQPLKVRTSGKITTKDQVFLLGHPLGLPLVFSPSAEISDNSNPVYFKTRVNSFRGNSGSPLFNAKTFLVEGILVRGEEDLQFDEINQCQRYAKYLSTDVDFKLKGESVTRIKYILPFLSSAN